MHVTRPSVHSREVEQAEQACEQSRWDIRVQGRGAALFDIVGRGTAAGRSFTVKEGPIHLRGNQADTNELLDAIPRLERKLAAVADRFHSALPIPFWTATRTASMSPLEKVERARSEYQGDRLQAITLGLTDWFGFLIDKRLDLATHEHVLNDGVAVRLGRDIRYVVAPA